MTSAAATNKVTPTAQSRYFASAQQGGIVTNPSIAVGGIEAWKRKAIEKVIGFRSLQDNWDSHGSHAPGRAVRTTAIEFLLNVPDEMLPAPHVVPVPGGGVYFEWSMDNRELEVTISPDAEVEIIRVQAGKAIDDEEPLDYPTVFGWLAAR